VCIYDSELMCGTLDKSTLGSGSKNNVFHVLMRDFGPDIAANRMSRLARLCARWIGNQGFSIGVSDVTPSAVLEESKRNLIQHHYKKCDEYIAEYKAGKLVPQPGCNEEQTLEAMIHKELSEIRSAAGNECQDQLHPLNAPLIMAQCGSKGGKLNISQMVACVGQQDVGGSRIANGFVRRTLPHFDIDGTSQEQ